MKKTSEKTCRIKNNTYLCTRKTKGHGSVAQLNRASDYGSEGYRFESCRSHTKKRLNLQPLFFIISIPETGVYFHW